jgi:hypothetical protein
MNNLRGFYSTRQNVSIEIKVDSELDYYYIFINNRFIKKYKNKMKVYNYLKNTFGIVVLI